MKRLAYLSAGQLPDTDSLLDPMSTCPADWLDERLTAQPTGWAIKTGGWPTCRQANPADWLDNQTGGWPTCRQANSLAPIRSLTPCLPAQPFG